MGSELNAPAGIYQVPIAEPAAAPLPFWIHFATDFQ